MADASLDPAFADAASAAGPDTAKAAPRRFDSFAEFYPFYLSEHENPTCRRLHFVGSTVGLTLLGASLVTKSPKLAVFALVQGYAWAWVGHFVFEKNKPASFKQPLYSFMGDWKMWYELATGKIPFDPSKGA